MDIVLGYAAEAPLLAKLLAEALEAGGRALGGRPVAEGAISPIV